jgi:hypothetical protein
LYLFEIYFLDRRRAMLNARIIREQIGIIGCMQASLLLMIYPSTDTSQTFGGAS